MERNVLFDYETFNEFPDKYLKINKNSSYYLVQYNNESFVTKKNIDNISIINFGLEQKIMIEQSYYNVKDGNLALKTNSICDIDGNNKMFIGLEKDVKIISLSSILNIKGNDKYYLSSSAINVLINYEKESEKIYTKKSGK